MKNKTSEFDEIEEKSARKLSAGKLKKQKIKKSGFAIQKKIMEASGYYQVKAGKTIKIIDKTKLNKKNRVKNGIIR
jgi:LysM repeat protein